MTAYNVERFVEAQQHSHDKALAELKKGRKQTHWMWYIFPQIRGLGFSETSQHYAIKDLDEAEEYLEHPVLGSRLVFLCNLLLALKSIEANDIFGTPDNLKLKSSMTLFAGVAERFHMFALLGTPKQNVCHRSLT